MALLVAKNLDSAQWAEEYWNFACRAYLTFYASLLWSWLPDIVLSLALLLETTVWSSETCESFE